MRLAHFIVANFEALLLEWEKFAATLVTKGKKNDRALLRDHVKKVIETIAADLADPESAHERSEKSKGQRTETKTAASIHGADRLESGFSLNATMAEYRAFRASVIRLWQDAHRTTPFSATANEDIIRFNEAIDQAVSESVASYSYEKDQQTRLLETLLSSSPDPSATYDLDGRLRYANKALTTLLECQLQDIAGKSFHELNFPSPACLQKQIEQVIANKQSLRGETAFSPPAGPALLFEYIFAPVVNDNGKVEAVASTARDITERKAIEHANWHTANYDLLTGLPNRRLFCDRLAQDLMHAGRAGVLLALLFIDLDRFKEANDRFGHDAGDILLRLVADRLCSCVRKTDTVARLGGDEFTVILNGVADAEHAGMLAGKILKKLARSFRILKNTIHISASIGIALSPLHTCAPEQLIKNADKAMYVAKRLGRNRFNFFSADKNKEQSASERLRLIEDLHCALAQHQLSIYYQPIFELQSGRLIKAEALLRWDHPKIGLMLPAQFIKLAEDAALVDEFNDIGNWVFAEAALRAREWSLLSGASFQVGINLSARQFTDHCNCLRWGAYIKTLGLAAQCVSIDIREDALLKGTIDVNDHIVKLHEAGIGLTVDNFGRGRLSMTDLKKLSVDTIKIAQTLVRNSTLNAGSRRATKDIITLAHRQGVKVVAEGVEKIEQLDWLQDAGCDYVQGYLLAEPVQAPEFEKLLQHA